MDYSSVDAAAQKVLQDSYVGGTHYQSTNIELLQTWKTKDEAPKQQDSSRGIIICCFGRYITSITFVCTA